MKDEFTEKMHSEFTIPKEIEIKLKVGSAIHSASILKVKNKDKFEQILKDYSVTFSDYEKWKKYYKEFGLELEDV